MSVVATRPAGGGAQPQRVTIGSDGGLDPLKAAVWRMGRAPREPLLKATEVLPAPAPVPLPVPPPQPFPLTLAPTRPPSLALALAVTLALALTRCC